METIGIIGFGTIGGAIARGLARSRADLQVFATRKNSIKEILARARTIIICVKPQQMRAVLAEMGPALRADHIIVSTAAGVSLEKIVGQLAQPAIVARAMPNISCELGQGMSALAFASGCSDEARRVVAHIFDLLGKTIELEERHFDAVTAISGCGPAYVCVIIEALTDGGVKQGLPRDAARLLVVQTLLGSAQLVLDSKEHPAAIRDRVTTPGGCTIDALAELEAGRLRNTLISAVASATRKSVGL